MQYPVPDPPEESLVFLFGSRYCETDHLSQIAWNLFEHAPTGWARVQRTAQTGSAPVRPPKIRLSSPSKTNLPNLSQARSPHPAAF